MTIDAGHLLNLLSYREAVLRAEAELAGCPCSLESWKADLCQQDRELLDVYERSTQRAFDDIAYAHTGGLN